MPFVIIHRSKVGDFGTRSSGFASKAHVWVTGELDVFGTEFLIRTVQEILSGNPGCTDVTLDLEMVTFVDVLGLRGIISACELLISSGCTVSLRSVTPEMRQVASLAHMELPK